MVPIGYQREAVTHELGRKGLHGDGDLRCLEPGRSQRISGRANRSPPHPTSFGEALE